MDKTLVFTFSKYCENYSKILSTPLLVCRDQGSPNELRSWIPAAGYIPNDPKQQDDEKCANPETEL